MKRIKVIKAFDISPGTIGALAIAGLGIKKLLLGDKVGVDSPLADAKKNLDNALVALNASKGKKVGLAKTWTRNASALIGGKSPKVSEALKSAKQAKKTILLEMESTKNEDRALKSALEDIELAIKAIG